MVELGLRKKNGIKFGFIILMLLIGSIPMPPGMIGNIKNPGGRQRLI